MNRYSWIIFLLARTSLPCAAQDSVLQFVFTSDVHYGITRPHFRGTDSTPSSVVSRAMIAAINRLPGGRLPGDGGVGAGKRVGHVDGILITGDIANRQETGIQAAARSWEQYEADYDHLVQTKDRYGKLTPILLGPGNHDVSNSIGFWRPVHPAVDATSMAGIYNRMMKPVHPVTAADYHYSSEKVNFVREFAGIRLVFLTLWPDSTEQAWMEKHLTGDGPALLFAHSQPDVEPRFFTNPNGDHGIDSTNKFEDLLPEVYQDGRSLRDSTLIEQRGLVAFLQRHPQIKAYFHGHNNWTQFYEWRGPDANIALPCFRVDSPMKGNFSSVDETLLSFQLITIDPHKKTMTVRECLWNAEPGNPAVVKWGQVKTINL